jgi:hypothetical protein
MYGLKIKVIPLPEFEKSFRQNDDGWVGGDCAFSLPLSNNRVLWLFGDSFVQNKTLSSQHGAALINNSIAIQQGNLLKESDSLHFYWKKENGKHRAFFVNENEPGFLWPLSAVLNQNKLFVFCVRIIITDPERVFGFEQIGNEIFCIENPNDEPYRWQMTVYKLPFQRQLGSYGSNFFGSDEYLYIYGYRNVKSGWNNAIINLIIARIPIQLAHGIYDLNNWEYLDGKSEKWTANIREMKPVIEHFTTEFSITFIPKIKKYVLVANAWKHPHPITVRFADTPYGPFSKPKIIYQCPEIEWSPNYFCYAAKAHPELADRDDELIVSYMTNSKVLHDCFEDLRIYFPKFVRIIIEIN